MKQLKKWISILLILSLMLPVFPNHVHAAEHTDDESVIYYVTPPVYVNSVTQSSGVIVEIPEVQEGIATFADESDYITPEEATVIVREAIKARKSSVTVYVKHKSSSGFNAAYDEVYNQVYNGCMRHTGVPTEGDYIGFQFARFGAPGSGRQSNGYFYFTMNFQMEYYNNAEHERVMDAEVAKLLSQLNLNGKSDYEKVKAVYDWMCANIVYDHDNLEDSSYVLKYTGYAALVNRTAVCQGFSVLFYRLMLELGVDTRIISGFGNGGRHSWNIVKLGGKYYNLDATWDEPRYKYDMPYDYFLRSATTFGNHSRDEEYETAEFHSSYPMSDKDYVPGAENVGVTGVKLDQNSVSINTGDTVKLTATVQPNSATNKSVVFTSSNPAVAAVNATSGLVTGVGTGTATITVTTADGGFTDTCTVTVSCSHIFNEQIEDEAHLVPETGDNCQTMKEYYYSCSLCGQIGTERWIGSQRGDHTFGTEWSQGDENGHWHACTRCGEGTGQEPHTPNIDAPTAAQDMLCTVCGYIILPRLDADHVVAEGLWDGGPVRWKITADGTLTITGNKHIQGKSEYIWKEYSRMITRIVIADGITKIPESAFSQMENVTSVYIGNKVASIGENAFAQLPNLKEITFPASLTTIGRSAFGYCPNLQTVNFAADGMLEKIGPYAFTQSGVKKIVTPASLKTIDEYAFLNCEQLEYVHLTEGLETIVHFAFSGCTNLKRISIPSTVTDIRGGVLDGCMALEHFEYYSSLLMDALSDRTSLKSAVYGGNATILGTSFFANCTALTDVTLGDNIEIIGDFAFSGCTALSELKIPDSVKQISGSAFAGTTALKELEMPASVERIDGFAFRDSGIQELTFLGNAPAFDANCFSGVTATVYYPGDDTTWKRDVMQSYGGNITWVPVGGSHAHDYIPTAVVDPTCTEDGYTVYTCTCGDTYHDSIVPAAGHSFQDWYEDMAPTCSNEGTMHRICEKCSYTDTESIPKLDHDYEITETPPTCVSPGLKEYRCRICGHYDSSSGASATYIHTYQDDYDAVCDVCGYERNLHPIDDFVLPFTEEEWENLKAINEFCVEAYLEPRTAIPALHEAARIRAHELNEVYQPYRPDGSDSTTIFDELGIPMKKSVEYCMNFDHTYSGWHNFLVTEVYNYILPHYALSGYNGKYALEMIDDKGGGKGGGKTCSDYSDLYIVVPDNLTVYEGMSVSDMGLIALVNCSSHGTCYLPVIDAYCPDYNFNASEFTVTIFGMSRTLQFQTQECPHDWSYQDCTVAETCSFCGAVRAAADHDYAEWSLQTAADCTNPGLETRKCRICAKFESREIPATGHQYKTNVVDPTCTEEGYTVFSCSCGDSYKDAITPALGHSGGEATCAKQAVCAVCGQSYGEKNPENHTGGTEVRNAADATEFEDGYTGDTHCAGCGKLLSKGEVIPATHTHSYENWKIIQEPTVDAEGVEQGTCSCGETSTRPVPKLEGHSFQYGDVNHDGDIKISDAILVMKYRAGNLSEGDTFCERCANVKGDGPINIQSAILIMKKRANKNMLFPVELQ